jgi:hypothetical protein
LRLDAKAAATFFGTVELQDVRFWGSEVVPPGRPPDPTIYGLGDGVDLHQGFVGVRLGAIELKIGRQEIAFANERILGAAAWAQPGRAFDAARMTVGDADLGGSVFGAVTADAAPHADGPEALVAGAFGEVQLVSFARFGGIALYDRAAAGPAAGATSSAADRGTFGVRLNGGAGDFQYDLDGYAQLASAAGATTTAFLGGSRASWGPTGVPLAPRVGFLLDAASGANAARKRHAFATLFGTNHAYYGLQDVFGNLPLDTKGRGLIDGAPTAAVKIESVTVHAAFHVFAPFETAGLREPLFGVEPDLVVSWSALPWLGVEGGGSAFFPAGDAFATATTFAPWGYLQTNATF